jgi:UDP-3-O-[3-hydroxymyristoyl] glucosamine N-acyltransferase
MADRSRVYTLAQLANYLGARLRGPEGLPVRGIGTVSTAAGDEICFLADKRHSEQLAHSVAAAIMLTEQMASMTERPILICDSPYLAYARVSQLFDTTPLPEPGTHPSAAVHPDARIAAGVSIGANCVVEQDVVLAAGAVVGACSVVGQRSRLGENSRLCANVTLYHDVTVGKNCTIHSGVVIGADGFGFAPDQERWERIAQNGGVVVGDGVSVGANTTIDRGAIGDTVIEDGVIIDNLCQIAHNVRIGRFSGLAGTCGIAGSTTIGAHCTFAGGAGAVGHIQIADGVHVTARTVITKSIREKGSWSAGTPTMPSADWRRAAVRFTQLDRLVQRVAALEQKLKGE